MGFRGSTFYHINLLVLFALVALFATSCNPTKHVPEGQYLLRSNDLKLKTDKGITRRGELKDNIERLIIQKPNTYALNFFPYKVWIYNLRYEKYKDTTVSKLKTKSVEQPVIYDSLLAKRSVTNIRNYLFNQGYFYPTVRDTVKLKDKKAKVEYIVETGTNFLIRKTTVDADDSSIADIARRAMNESLLKEGQPFSMSLLEQERSRLTNVLRDAGYYKFSQENIVDFSLDTFNKELIRDIENPFESAINFLASQGSKKEKKPTLDIKIVIRTENPDVYRRYVINNVSVFPDFVSREDIRDSTLYQSYLNGVRFRYHKWCRIVDG